MNQDKLISLAKRWRELELSGRALDYDTSVFARDVRCEVHSDVEMLAWCREQLGMSEAQAGELILRAMAIRIVPGRVAYQKVGGWKHIAKLRRMPPRERVLVIREATSQGKRIGDVILAHQRAQGLAVGKRRPSNDAAQLAIWILANASHIPDPIRKTINRYVATPAPTHEVSVRSTTTFV